MKIWYCPELDELLLSAYPGKYLIMPYAYNRNGTLKVHKYEFIGML